jgi:hypothetical protein
MIKFDYPIALDMYKMTCLDWQGGFFTIVTFGYFLIKKSSKKTTNCISAHEDELGSFIWFCEGDTHVMAYKSFGPSFKNNLPTPLFHSPRTIKNLGKKIEQH